MIFRLAARRGRVSASRVVRWCPPPASFAKINVDASWSKDSRLGFAGVVIRDDLGRFVAATRYPLLAPNVAVAEAWRCFRVVSLVHRWASSLLLLNQTLLKLFLIFVVPLIMAVGKLFPS